ncbi:MAG: type II secretion system F family protein [Stackebrandtia sp.]
MGFVAAHRWQLVAAAAAAAGVWAVTSWPVAGLAAGALAWAAPVVFGPDRDGAATLARTEAVAAWSESLRDSLSAAAGLEQAIIVTAKFAPPAIATQVARLADRLDDGHSLPDALRGFARDIDDDTTDLVVVSLTMAHRHHGANLAALLGQMAGTARDRAALRMTVAASRSRVRTATRLITTIVLAMIAGLWLFSRAFLSPYSTLEGQLVLTVAAGLFAASLWMLHRLSQLPEPKRLLRAATTGKAPS